MERRVEFIGSIIIFFILLFVYSKFGPSLPINITTQSKGEPLVVSETGKVSVTPDTAKVTIGIEEQGKNLKVAQENVNRKSKSLVDELKKLGVKESSIKTVNYNVYPEYDYQSSPFRINGYRVSTSYEIKIEDFEVVNDVLVVAANTGANVINNIIFEVNEKTKEEKLQEAREIAVNKAKTKAEGLAKASGMNLGKIINVSEVENGNYPMPVTYAKELSVGSGDSRDVANVTPGETNIEVTVSLSYEVR